jgi:heterotetrameric sarcosine oxidase gamma subunit
MPELKTSIEVDDRFQLFEIAGWSEAGFEALLHQLGLPLPRRPGEVSTAAGRRVLRIGPCLAWVLAGADMPPLGADTDNGVVVDLSSSRVRLHLTGNMADTLRQLVAVDFDRLESIAFIASVIHGVPVTILHAPAAFDLLVPRSFAANLVEWIDDAALARAP